MNEKTEIPMPVFWLYAICGLGAAIVIGVGLRFTMIASSKNNAGDDHFASPHVLQSVEYDGHRWITSKDGGWSWQPIHHPDCPCHSAPDPGKP